MKPPPVWFNTLSAQHLIFIRFVNDGWRQFSIEYIGSVKANRSANRKHGQAILNQRNIGL